MRAPKEDLSISRPPSVNKWLCRCVLILAVGGGFHGSAGTLQAFLATPKASWPDYVAPIFFIALYCYGIFTGIRLSEKGTFDAHLFVYFALQVPVLSSPILVYQFASGFQAVVAIVVLGVEWTVRLGSEWQFAVLQSHRWSVGLNFFATAVLLLMYIQRFGGGEALFGHWTHQKDSNIP